jgi:pectinesterase
MLFRNTMLTAGMRKLVLVFGMLIAVLLLHAQQQVVSVAQDGTGNFRTIQEAVNASANHSQTRIVILVKKGTYNEKLVIPSWKTSIMLKGEDKEHTIITWNDYSGKGEINTFTSYTVLVQGNDFRAENITFENSAGTGVGQAVALHVEADRCVFVNCKIVANQDTLYAGVDNSRQYYKDCYIEGTTDFIFGSATVVFDTCHIHGKKNSYITAASTPQRQRFGFVFRNCTITTSPETTKLYLGRPWRPFAKTVFIECSLNASILPEGWHNWNKPDAEGTSFYAEYQSTGAGASPTTRVPWSHQLTAVESNVYTLENIFGDWNAAALD